VGFLYVRNGIHLDPLIYGGGQEKNLRSGTENVAGAVGLAKALDMSQKTREKENKRLKTLRDYFITQLLTKLPGAMLNGPDERTAKKREKEILRLPNNVHISIPGVEGEALTLYLDSYNIAVSTGSACTTGTTDPSHVVMAIGKSKMLAIQSVRFTLGESTTKKDLDYVLKVLPGICDELKKVAKL
jgi:cysteine desulfurase